MKKACVGHVLDGKTTQLHLEELYEIQETQLDRWSEESKPTDCFCSLALFAATLLQGLSSLIDLKAL